MEPTLAEFLLARIAERERRVDTIPDWYCTDSARGESWGSRGNCPLCDSCMFDGTESVTEDAMWEHYEAVHERTFVLAECKAKWRIVQLGTAPYLYSDFAQVVHNTSVAPILRALALPYAAHPDFREEWRA